MTPIIFALQFTGKAGPMAGTSGVMTATMTAAATNYTAAMTASGISATIHKHGDATAAFSSVVTVTGEGTFLETGTISYGPGASLVFATAGQGAIGASAASGITSGAIIWKIVSGEGQMAGATGYITSNFTVSAAGDVVDNQTAVIFLAAK